MPYAKAYILFFLFYRSLSQAKIPLRLTLGLVKKVE